MQNLLTDLRFATRSLAANRSYSIPALLTLALGIGLTTAVFSVLYGVVLRPLPLRNESRLVTICERFPGASASWCSISPPNLTDIAARSRSFDALGFARSWTFTLTTPDGAENLRSGLATREVFEALGIVVEKGRLMNADDQSNVSVITHEMWQTRFGGDPAIIGRSITLDRGPSTIIGVLEPGAVVPVLAGIELWRPPHIDPRDERNRDWRGFVAYGRLRAGASMASARSEVARVAGQLRDEHFASTPGWDLTLRSLHDRVVGEVRTPILLFFGATALVLLIACANVANIVIARGAARTRELTLRSALGASRGRLVGVLLAESLVLGVGGAALGAALAYWLTPAIKILAPADVPRLAEIGTNANVLAFAVLVGVLTSLLFGLLPAFRLSRVDVGQALREGGRSLTGSGRAGRALVVAETAIAVPLVVGALLLARSFESQMSWQPGFDRDHILTFSLFLPNTDPTRRADVGLTWGTLEREVAAIPGVAAVGTSSAGPLYGGHEVWEMEVDGRPANDKAMIRWFDVSPGFFAALGVPLVRGTDFGPEDVFGAGVTSGLVNETLANRYFPGEDPIGKHLVFRMGKTSATFTVRGVVRDIPSLRTGEPVEPQLYWSNRQVPRPFSYFVVRTTVPPASIVAAVRDRVRAQHRDYRPAAFSTMSDLIAGEMHGPRFSMALLAAFALTALALAAIGTYGLLAYFVAQRSRDIGIRMALGASRGTVIGGFLRSGLALTLIGCAIGVAAALGLSRTLRAYVFGVSSTDPLLVGLSVAAVLLVGVLASLIPSWRASRVDPAAALVAE